MSLCLTVVQHLVVASDVKSAETKYQSCRGILHRLKAADKVDRQADQRSVTVVQPAE